MDFARKELKKYGWKEGEGLGKHKSGILKALKPKLKFDTGGLGYDIYEDINNTWWQRLYDEAAKNIFAKKFGDNSIILETLTNSINIIAKKKKFKEQQKWERSFYQDFVKTSLVTHNMEKRLIEEREDIEPKVKKKKMTSGICDLTDEELFEACGGCTLHMGARHGLRMNAKLARIEKQECNLSLHKSESQLLEETLKKSHRKKKKRSI